MLATAAGTLATVLFIASNVPMLLRAWRTRDLASYSLGALTLTALGQAFQWVYLWSLPLGPIHVLNAFSTIAVGAMLGLYLRYRKD